jgi:glutamine amidotransferase
MRKVCILDYGMGNVRSIINSLKKIKVETFLYSEKKNSNFDALIIPGVGSFDAAMRIIRKKYIKFINKAKNEKKLIIGICLGLHIFFTTGYEGKKTKGLNFIKGSVKKIKSKRLPNIGWKCLKFRSKRFKRFSNKEFYFVHSFEVLPKNKKNIIATTNYHNRQIVSIIKKENVIGIQFHPEKSRSQGLEILKKIIFEL